MKIPFKAKTKDCKTLAGYVALYSKVFESYFGTSKLYKEEEKACRESKDSAKELDKTINKLTNKVIKRTDLKWEEKDYINIARIADIYIKLKGSEQDEYNKKYEKMKSDYYEMERLISDFNKKNDNKLSKDIASEESLKKFKLPLPGNPELFGKGKLAEFVDMLNPDNLK